MNRSLFCWITIATIVLDSACMAAPSAPEEVYPGVWRFTFGAPEKITPVSTRHFQPAADGLAALPKVADCPINITAGFSDRGVLISAPLDEDEMIYGLGLQLQSFQQRGLKKKLRVNADPVLDTGDSHAPVPFYVTTKGYGVFVDTARYATFYLGNKKRKPGAAKSGAENDHGDSWNYTAADAKRTGLGSASEVLVEVPEAAGADVYVFAGPSLREAVQRYNLFSGGGPLPPRWGLGFWYRGQTDYTQTNVLDLAAEFRQDNMPCDVLGLEPHWQTHAYSCSYVWGPHFPAPAEMLSQLAGLHFRLNLWEHAFVHPSSPIYDSLLPLSGDYEVWGGLVPDFISPQARAIFADYHLSEHVSIGVSGYKGDECDNSDFTGNWSFPEISRFPSGADGEQMHCLFGLRYQDALTQPFDQRRERTYGLVRSSGALAAPYPYVLYSDLYDHREFVHAIPQSGFCGLLWTPEVRDSSSPNELVRRMESVCFSPMALINAWYLLNPPWKQVDRKENNDGHFADNWQKTEAACRSVMELRMKFIPWLQAAFVRYHREGLPPFRALVMDYPDDPKSRAVDDEYIMGDGLLVAPIIINDSNRDEKRKRRKPVAAEAESPDGSASRAVYLPPGDWQDFWSGKHYKGGREFQVRVPLGQIPLFVPPGTVLPLAQPTLHTDDPASWHLTAQVYGDGHRSATLYEDDGSYAPSLSSVTLTWDKEKKEGSFARTGEPAASMYQVTEWTQK